MYVLGTIMFLESIQVRSKWTRRQLIYHKQAVKDNNSAWSELLHTLREHTKALQRQLDQVGINDVVEQLEDSISGPIATYFKLVE